MRRTLTTIGLVVALMGLSISAMAEDHENGENGFVASISNGEVTFNDDILQLEEIEFEGLEETHGHYVAAAVYLLKSYEPADENDFDASKYRLGCLVKQVAQSDFGKDEGTDTFPFPFDYEDCLKKKYNENWTPPGKDPNFEPPGQAKKAENTP